MQTAFDNAQYMANEIGCEYVVYKQFDFTTQTDIYNYCGIQTWQSGQCDRQYGLRYSDTQYVTTVYPIQTEV